ncbi:MAG: hypothetical protein ACREHD_09910 [Pirellulales bacterium]
MPAGASVFIDANTFVYHFSPHPTFGSPSTDFLERINRQEINGQTSVDVLRDVAHRMMTIEATAQQGWPFAGIVQRLRKHPNVIQSLSLFRQAVECSRQPGGSCRNRIAGQMKRRKRAMHTVDGVAK